MQTKKSSWRGVRLEPQLDAELIKKAKQERRTVSQMMRILLADALKPKRQRARAA